MDDMLKSIFRDDPDQALKQAMASKQCPQVNLGPRINVPQDQNINCDNLSESNFSSQTSQPVDAQSQRNDPIFKVPMAASTYDLHSKMEKQLIREVTSTCKHLKRMPTQKRLHNIDMQSRKRAEKPPLKTLWEEPTAEYYYDCFLKRIQSFGLRVTADVLEQSTHRFMAPNSTLMGTMMMDCSSSASHYSNGRDNCGFQGSTMFSNQGQPTYLNESVRSTMFNGTKNPTVSSTTETPPDNQNFGTFLASKPPTVNSHQAPSVANQETNNTRNLDRTTTQTNTTSVGRGGSIFARPAVPLQPRAPNKPVENIRKSMEKKSSPAAKSSPLNVSVKNSPLSRTINSTVNSTLNRTSSQSRRNSISEEITLKNWTFALKKPLKYKDPTLHLRGIIYRRNGSGNSGEEIETAAIKTRLSDSCVRTVDSKVYHLNGLFQNAGNRVPKYICSSYITKRTFPVMWRKMITTWAARLKGQAKDVTVSDSSGLESPVRSRTKLVNNKRRSSYDSPIPIVKGKSKGHRGLNDTMTQMRKKGFSPLNTNRNSPVNSTLVNAKAKEKEREAIKAKEREMKAREKEREREKQMRAEERENEKIRREREKEKERQLRAEERENEKIQKAKEMERLKAKQKEALNKPVAKPVVKPVSKPAVKQGIKPVSKPVSKPVVRKTAEGRKTHESANSTYESANSSVDIVPQKRPRQAPIRFWNEADISLTEDERTKASFTDSIDASFKIVSPLKMLNNIRKLKDSNIINSQVTPPTAYFTSVMTSSEKKNEQTIEKTKKPLKRLADRVLKKGRTSQNMSSQAKSQLSGKDPKEIKKFIQESEVQFRKVSVSKSQLEDEMSEISDLLSDDDNDENEETF